MKIIFIGDIVGKSGREALFENFSYIKNHYKPDVIIANAENAASGYGLSKKIALELLNLGINVITLGNHAWDQREMLSYIEEQPRIIRAMNYPSGVPGKGEYKVILEDGRSIIVMQIMLRIFMSISLDDPFTIIKKRVSEEFLGTSTNGILIDMHGDITAEKNAFAHYMDGKVTAILGTHTHIPTADHRILENHTAYQTDVGMTGDYNSVIGFKKEGPIHGFVKGYRLEGRFIPAQGKGKVCGAFIESDDLSGLAKKIDSFQI